MDIIAQALADRVNAGLMEIEQVPVPLRELVAEKVSETA
jgi:hypothetical protein